MLKKLIQHPRCPGKSPERVKKPLELHGLCDLLAKLQHLIYPDLSFSPEKAQRWAWVRGTHVASPSVLQ